MLYMPETRPWLQLCGSVDTIIGVEMLSMLEMDADELLQKSLAFHKEEPGDANH